MFSFYFHVIYVNCKRAHRAIIKVQNLQYIRGALLFLKNRETLATIAYDSSLGTYIRELLVIITGILHYYDGRAAM